MKTPEEYATDARRWLLVTVWCGVGGIVLLFGGIAALSTVRTPIPGGTSALIVVGAVAVVGVCVMGAVARVMWRRSHLFGAAAELQRTADELRRAADALERNQRRNDP